MGRSPRSRWFVRILKAIAVGVGLMSGALSIIREAFALFSANPDPIWQRNLFWSCVWIAFVVSVVVLWIIENKRVRDLERQMESLYSKLDIEVYDSFTAGNDSHYSTFFISLMLKVTNEKREPNSIKRATLEIQVQGKHLDITAEEDPMRLSRSQDVAMQMPFADVPMFDQGAPRHFPVTFRVQATEQAIAGGEAAVREYLSDFAAKPYILRVVDSYNREFETVGVLPADLWHVKTLM